MKYLLIILMFFASTAFAVSDSAKRTLTFNCQMYNEASWNKGPARTAKFTYLITTPNAGTNVDATYGFGGSCGLESNHVQYWKPDGAQKLVFTFVVEIKKLESGGAFDPNAPAKCKLRFKVAEETKDSALTVGIKPGGCEAITKTNLNL